MTEKLIFKTGVGVANDNSHGIIKYNNSNIKTNEDIKLKNKFRLSNFHKNCTNSISAMQDFKTNISSNNGCVICSNKDEFTKDITLLVEDKILDFIFPVGSLYATVNSDLSPEQYFGGKWEKIVDRFLYCCPSSENSLKFGGSITHKHTMTKVELTEEMLPGHMHSVTSSEEVPEEERVTMTGKEDNASTLHEHVFTTCNSNDTWTLGAEDGVVNDEESTINPKETRPTHDSIYGKNSDGSFIYTHTHTISSDKYTDTAGDGKEIGHTHEMSAASNIPPYTTVICWIRVE